MVNKTMHNENGNVWVHDSETMATKPWNKEPSNEARTNYIMMSPSNDNRMQMRLKPLGGNAK